MAMEWPDYENEAKRKAKAKRQRRREGSFIVDDSDDETLETKVSKRKETSGLLFQVDFYRVILDEGQNIRNKTTRKRPSVSVGLPS
jgi:SNF2 family DNA or RNA helicase